MAEILTSGTTGGGHFDPLSWLVQESSRLPVSLNEEGEDEEENEDGDDAGEEEGGDEDGGGDREDSGSDSPAEEPKKPFENLELKDAFCFSWCPRSSELCWRNIADASVTKGWKNSDIKRLDIDLKKNVDACYYFLTIGEFEDLDTGYRWRASFVNSHCLWKLELADGSAEVLPEDAQAFFASEYFKKFSKRGADLIARGVKTYRTVVEPRLRNGELMSVDPVKLDAVLFTAENQRAIDNYRGCKYELQ